jgi:hypothetical protein
MEDAPAPPEEQPAAEPAAEETPDTTEPGPAADEELDEEEEEPEPEAEPEVEELPVTIHHIHPLHRVRGLLRGATRRNAHFATSTTLLLPP